MPGTTCDNEYTKPASEGIVREYGPQPIGDILAVRGLTNHQVVAASTEQLTHKMMAKACRGRYLSPKELAGVQGGLDFLRAVNKASGESYTLSQLFNY